MVQLNSDGTLDVKYKRNQKNDVPESTSNILYTRTEKERKKFVIVEAGEINARNQREQRQSHFYVPGSESTR